MVTGADLDTLDGLVAKSLLVRRWQPGRPTRLGMLETIRAYAAERLAIGDDEEALRERHYRCFLALAQRHGTDRALWGRDRKEHLAWLDPEIDNLHAALGWAVGRADAERSLALCAALGWYWLMRDRYADAVRWIDGALKPPPMPIPGCGLSHSASRSGPCGRWGAEPSNPLSSTRLRRSRGRLRTR